MRSGVWALRAAGLVLPPLALLLAAGLYFKDLLPLPEPRRYITGDFARYFYPVYRYVAEEIAAGRLPHWTPYVGVGYPLLSDIEASVFYPPVRLMTLLTGPPNYWALELYAIAHFVVAGFGMLVLGQEMGLPILAASAGAFTFMFSGFFWAHASHVTILQSVAWAPWVLAANARAVARRSAGWTVVAGAGFAVTLLGGHPQIALYVGVALALFCGVASASGWPGASWRQRLALPASTAAVIVLGLGLAAPQLAPTLALAPATDRWNPSPDFLRTDTLPIDQLVTFLVPLAYFGTDRFHSADEFSASVGIGALLLASAAVVLRRDVWSRYLGLLVLAGLTLALAPAIPGVTRVAARLPILSFFRASARATLLTDFGLAALAGLGLDAWTRTCRARDMRRRVRALAVGWRVAVALAAAGWVVVRLDGLPAWVGPLASQFPEFYAYFLGMLVAHVAVLEAWRAGWLPSRLAALATLALVLTNVMYPHRASAWTTASPEAAWQSNDLVRQLRAAPGQQRVWNDGWLQRRGLDFEANAGLVHRIEIVSQYTSLPTARADDFSRSIQDPWLASVLVDLLNVRHLVLFEADTRPRGLGKYSPPHLEPGDERRYDLTALLEGPLGEITVVIEPDPGAAVMNGATLTVTGGSSLDACLGCRAPAGQTPAMFAGHDRTRIASAALPSHRPATRLTLRNRLPYPLNVRHLRLDAVDLYSLGVRYRQLGPTLWENENALPRAFLVREVLVLPDTGRIIPTLLSMGPRRTAIVERPLHCQGALRPGDPPSDEAVELLEYRPMRVRLRTHDPRPAFLVLADAQYKDWRARVDGQRTGTYYADLVFRGLCVPGGEHEIEFRYHPFAVQRGLIIALLAGLGAVAAVGIARWRPSGASVRPGLQSR